MSQIRRRLAGCAVMLACAAPAAGQQGSLQVTSAAQTLNGDPSRTAGQPAFEPDLGLTWFQPGTRFSMFQLELRAARRNESLGMGRAFIALRDFKARGILWSVEGGDTYFSPAVSDYRFPNLTAPPVTFAGAIVTARTRRVHASFLAGRATAWRNVFGTDPDVLGQDLLVGRTRIAATDHLELSARASRVRTYDLGEFAFSMSASDQAGGGAKLTVNPAVQLVFDASVVSFQRRDSDRFEQDASGLVGANVLLSRGWIQANLSRFSPGDFPVMNQPLADRQTAFAAGEYDVARRWRAFAGVETYETNLDGTPVSSTRPAANSGTRGFGGLRLQTGARSTVAFRFEDGDRRARLVAGGRNLVSDSGVLGAEWQTTLGEVNTFARYSRRENVEPLNADASFTQHDLFAHVVWSASRELQIFGTAGATQTTTDSGGGSTYWQLGGGGQMQMHGRGLWLRGEGTVSRHLDLLTQQILPQESLNIGLNGEIAYRTTLGFNVYADHLANSADHEDSWAARSMLRLTRSFATGSPRAAGNGSTLSFARARGTGAVVGLVFKDWNGNGAREADEEPLEGIPVRLANAGSANTSREGGFTFANVPVGVVGVGLDLSALPVDFDPPLVSEVQVDLPRGETRQVAFGLIPLGSVHGRVVRDVNGNGYADAGEPSVDGAVVVLDNGARSEQVRKGQFRFESVRTGTHAIELLIDSLPQGGEIVGEAPSTVDVSRARLDAEADFAVMVRPRAEVRKVFPPSGTRPDGTPAPTTTVPPATDSVKTVSAPDASSRPSAPRAAAPATVPQIASSDKYAIQVAALNDPLRARALVLELQTSGFAAYLIEPSRTDPDAPYRIRIGPFASREAAQRVVDKLQKNRGEKLWVTREVSGR